MKKPKMVVDKDNDGMKKGGRCGRAGGGKLTTGSCNSVGPKVGSPIGTASKMTPRSGRGK
jgi:hypothetical protein